MNRRVIFLVLLSALLVPWPALADSFEVFVGYADNLRPSPFFPIGFGAGFPLGPIAPGVTSTFVAAVDLGFDSGAILIVNTGASPLTINDLSATVPTWTTNPFGGPTATGATTWAGAFPVTVAPGDGAIFAQTFSFDFDTSDVGAGLNIAMNCDPTNPFAIANPGFCASIAPSVMPTIGGIPMTFMDTGQVLDTGGFDFALANPCPIPGGGPGTCNESLQWRLIGTTGISNPGGVTPEPGTLLLLGTGLAGIGTAGWRRKFSRRKR